MRMHRSLRVNIEVLDADARNVLNSIKSCPLRNEEEVRTFAAYVAEILVERIREEWSAEELKWSSGSDKRSEANQESSAVEARQPWRSEAGADTRSNETN